MLKNTISLSQPIRGSGYNEYLLGKMQNKQTPQDFVNQATQNISQNSLMDSVSSFATELRSQNLVRAMATVEKNAYGMTPTLKEQGAIIDEHGNISFQNSQVANASNVTNVPNVAKNPVGTQTASVNASPMPQNLAQLPKIQQQNSANTESNPHEILNSIPLKTNTAKALPQDVAMAFNRIRPMALDTKSLNILNRLANRESHSEALPLSTKEQNILRTAKSLATLTSQKMNPAGYELGELSKKYESATAGSMSIGYDRNGGTSYGTYQLSSRAGTFDKFIEFLQDNEPKWAEKLRQAGNANTGSRKGAVPTAWQELCKENPERMKELEHNFIVKSHFEPVLSYAKEKWTDKIAPAVKEVLFSASVQHGVNGAKHIIDQALSSMKADRKTATQTTAQNTEESATTLLMDSFTDTEKTQKTVTLSEQKSFIENIYEHRKNKFGSSTLAVQEAAKNRFIQEEKDALKMLS